MEHSETPAVPNRGTAEVDQAAIEERALEIAKGAGRDQVSEFDLAEARREILGEGSTVPTDEQMPGEDLDDRDTMPR